MKWYEVLSRLRPCPRIVRWLGGKPREAASRGRGYWLLMGPPACTCRCYPFCGMARGRGGPP